MGQSISEMNQGVGKKNSHLSLSARLLFFLVSLIIVLLDYVTKLFIVNTISPHDSLLVLPFLRIVHVKNTGAAFGILQGLGNEIFIIITLIAIVGFVIFILKSDENLLSLSFILGGAIGNIIDRISRGFVIDFIDVFAGKYHWPAFNVADSAITAGMVLLFIHLFRKKS